MAFQGSIVGHGTLRHLGSCSLIRLMSWVVEEIWAKSSAHVCKSLCHSRLQLNNVSVSGGRVMGNSKASLAGSITSIAACSFQQQYVILVIDFYPPVHHRLFISNLASVFISLISFHVILSLLITWRTGNVSILTCFQWMSTHFGSSLPTPSESEVKCAADQLELISGATTMPKSFFAQKTHLLEQFCVFRCKQSKYFLKINLQIMQLQFCKAVGMHHVIVLFTSLHHATSTPGSPDAHLVMNEGNCRKLHLKEWLHNACHNKLINRS